MRIAPALALLAVAQLLGSCNREAGGCPSPDCRLTGTCPAGTRCNAYGTCTPGCVSDADCGGGKRCQRGFCECPFGTHACGSLCADDRDPERCGPSCTRCAAPVGAQAACAGTCLVRCPPGTRLCGGACASVPRDFVFTPSGPSSTFGDRFGEVDGDGIPDAVGGGPSFLHGRGDGTFALLARGNYAVSPIEAGDVDGDGRVDVVGMEPRSTGGIVVFRFDPAIAPEVPPPVTSPSDYGGMGEFTLADLDGDGHLDVFAVGNAVFAASGRGDATFEVRWRGAPEWAIHSLPATGDFDRDGLMDVAALLYSDNDPVIAIYRGTGSMQFARARVHAVPEGAHSLLAADLDGDGWTDLLVLGSGGRASVLRGSATGFRARRVSQLVPGAYMDGALGDADGDGRQELLVLTSGDAGGELRAFRPLADGTFAPAGVFALPGLRIDRPVMADLNIDGWPDVVVPAYEGAMIAFGGCR